tara:strand:+ start:118 stop:489 length:372 start_codon:yes stop_codon:yes gene_type:complete
MDTKLFAKQATKEVPVWDLYERSTVSDGLPYLIGHLTSFPGEGPMATVRLQKGDSNSLTVKAGSLHTCLYLAREAYVQLVVDRDYWESQEHIEDEDGSRAYGEMLERQAEAHAMRYEFDEPCY